MKRYLVGAATAVAMSAGSAIAADMTVKAPVYKAPPPVVVQSWTGCYIGGNAGGGRAKTEQTRIGLADGTVLPHRDYGSDSSSSFIGGGQIGCDYQFGGNWVVGLQDMVNFGKVN